MSATKAVASSARVAIAIPVLIVVMTTKTKPAIRTSHHNHSTGISKRSRIAAATASSAYATYVARHKAKAPISTAIARIAKTMSTSFLPLDVSAAGASRLLVSAGMPKELMCHVRRCRLQHDLHRKLCGRCCSLLAMHIL